MSATSSLLWRNPMGTAALVVAAGGAAAILGAWLFQYGLGLAPCPLCLQQRWPYYAAIPLAMIVAIGAQRGLPRKLMRAGLTLVALLLLATAALGVYHAGVEWKWWEGPQDCAAAGEGFAAGSASDLLRRMQAARVVRCDEAAWRDPVLRLSLAGWNVVIALALAGVAVAGIVAGRHQIPTPR
jgi:disulfide bond formation protein DsbB